MKTSAPKTITLAILAALLIGGSGAVGNGARRVSGHVPKSLLARSKHLGRHSSSAKVQLAISLNLRDQAGLDEFLHGVADPADPRFERYLTLAEFRERYAPTDAEVAAVVASLRGRGLRVLKVHENNLLIEAEGSSGAVEQAFQVELHDYQTASGSVGYAPSAEPLVQGETASSILAVNGLSTLTLRHPHVTKPSIQSPRVFNANLYMTPTKLRTAYNVASLSYTGTGQTLALMELDGYTSGNITQFATKFGLTTPTLQNVYVSSGGTTPTGTPGDGEVEVELDIEVAMAMAPGLSKIVVYEGVNTDAGVIATYSQISNDFGNGSGRAANQVSTSWGSAENGTLSATMNSEKTIFQQMAAQGQAVFAASGDDGAYDNTSTPSSLEVDDPASQPNVTGVGGTTISVNTTSGAYNSEASWGTPATGSGGGGGGGISIYWSQPSFQSGLANASNFGNGTSNRMVPDVSLNANPDTGYPIYTTDSGTTGWGVVGGTSAAAPIWAAFAAIVNQARVAKSMASLSNLNTTLYQIGTGGTGRAIFHDISDSSTNLHYPAVSGYDMSTGLGTINGVPLFNALTGLLPPTTVSTTSSTTALTVSWSSVTGASSYNVYRSTTATGTYTAVASAVAGTSYADTASVGTNYYYVTAVTGSNESAGSMIVSGAINQAVPSAPTGLTGVVK